VDGVDAALRPPLTLVFKTSSDGRDEVGVGDRALDEVMEGRGEDTVDIAECSGGVGGVGGERVGARSTAISGGLCSCRVVSPTLRFDLLSM